MNAESENLDSAVTSPTVVMPLPQHLASVALWRAPSHQREAKENGTAVAELLYQSPAQELFLSTHSVWEKRRWDRVSMPTQVVANILTSRLMKDLFKTSSKG